MLTFIGAQPTAAVVLCDLASTAYYIGGVVEAQIGKAAPWFILAVMLFSYAVRSVYIESCSMFVRGGVYRVVKEAMGHGMAKVSVSALMFDYILTGPISAVSAGHYLVRLFNALLHHFGSHVAISERWGAVGVALAVVIYFYQVNVRGIPASSDKALKIMRATTIMAVIMIIWCLVTLAARPATRALPPLASDLGKKCDRDGAPRINEVTKAQEDPLGWVGAMPIGAELRPGVVEWQSWIGLLGIVIAFGHSILAMSGEETLAQVYREVEAPKLRNFRRAAFIVFLYSLALTGLVSFFAFMIIPDRVRPDFQDNLISGLAMHVVGPRWAKLALNTLVVAVGFLILAGAVNTSIVGANGVLNRVAEDGVLPEWFRKPQRTFGTTWRLLSLIAGFQVAAILLSGGDVIVLGEAYAFGVVWSLVLKSLSMLVLRLREPDRYRGYRVPLNIRLGRTDLPIGLLLIFLVLLAAALVNLLTKTVATVSGTAFAAAFLIAFTLTERFGKKAKQEGMNGRQTDEHLEEFEVQFAEILNPKILGLQRPYRKVVLVERPDATDALRTCLIETDPTNTDVVVVTVHAPPPGGGGDPRQGATIFTDAEFSDASDSPLGHDDVEVMTAVVHKSEIAGKPVKPVVIVADAPETALLQAVRGVGAGELLVGSSDNRSSESRLQGLASRWGAISADDHLPLTIRVVGSDGEKRWDHDGGSRIPHAADDGGQTSRALAGVTSD
ncbi:MAG TPA: APC family permease [Pirellulales bacterium]|nr:APC family permease [Pirellulales bacterium]